MNRKQVAVAGAAVLLTTTTGAWAAQGADNAPAAARVDGADRSAAARLAAVAPPSAPAAGVLAARLRNADGERVGMVMMERMDDRRVIVFARVRSMTRGFHGFHVHTTGRCNRAADPVFGTAGGHFTNAGDGDHGEHAGDMPSLLVDRDGRALMAFVTDSFRMGQLRDADGAAVMVHEGRDNFANIDQRYASVAGPGPDATTLATGDAGARVACGVLHEG